MNSNNIHSICLDKNASVNFPTEAFQFFENASNTLFRSILISGTLVKKKLEVAKWLYERDRKLGALVELEDLPSRLERSEEMIAFYEELCRGWGAPPGYGILQRVADLDAGGVQYETVSEMLAAKSLMRLPQSLFILHRPFTGSPVSSREYFEWREEGEVDRAQALNRSIAYINFDIDDLTDVAALCGPEIVEYITIALDMLLGVVLEQGAVVANVGGWGAGLTFRYSMVLSDCSLGTVEKFVEAFLRCVATCFIKWNDTETKPGNITVSCGIVWYEKDVPGLEEIKMMANYRADVAREYGGNRYISK